MIEEELINRQSLLRSIKQECKDCGNPESHDCEDCYFWIARLYIEQEPTVCHIHRKEK